MQAWRRPPLPNASPDPANVTVTPAAPGPGPGPGTAAGPGPGPAAGSGPGTAAGPGLGTEPARDVEPERLTGHHGPQPRLHLGQPRVAQRSRPPGPDVFEDHRGQGQHLDAPRGEPGQLAPPVGVVVGAPDVAQFLEPVDRLARGLLGDAEPAARLGGR